MGSLPVLILLVAGWQAPTGPSLSDQPAGDQQSVLPQANSSNYSPSINGTPIVPYDPITGMGRVDWAVKSTIGPASLWTGLLSAGWGTGFDRPHEYGRSFDGFVKRYGLRMSGVATSNVMEATLGSFWGEDPRYHRSSGEDFRGRFRRTLKMTFLSHNRDGSTRPAYARYIAIAGSNVLSDTWRPNVDRDATNTMIRIGLGFGGRLLGNLWEEFWPDVKAQAFWNKH